SVRRFHDSANPEIDDVESVQAEISQVVMNAVDKVLAGESMKPGLVGTPTIAHLGDDHETIRVRIERLPDELIVHIRNVEVGDIDVVQAGLHRLPENSDGGVDIAWRSPHLRTSKLHCTVAHSVQLHRCALQRETAAEISLLHHFVSSSFSAP